jgi:hypothetical protein
MTPLDLAIFAIDNFAGLTPDDGYRTALIAAKCRALIRGYAIRWFRWSESIYEPTEVERIISADLTNPATGRKSRNLRVAGKLDMLANHSGKSVVVDHKTTSDDITDPAGTYWRQLVVESQPSHYIFLKWLNGIKVDEAMWDVLRKPSIAPKKLTKAERASVVANRRYFNAALSDTTMDWLQENDRENLEMYEARLLHDCTVERPQYYFARKTIPRLDSEIMDYAAELWDAGQLILEARRKDRWPKHPGSCMNYGSPCKFLGICSGQDRPDSVNWKPRESVHAELSTEQDRNTLTYSSIRCYQTCPRKFYHTYQLAIERIDEEERETLLFGHCWHTGLEAFWGALIPEGNENGNCITGSANSVERNSTNQAPLDW